MATPLSDVQSTPTTWTNWQAMRFLYQDVNSLLYGGGLDLSQFNLPALNLPHYFNTFSLIQGQGSTNSGTGTTNQPGGGGGGGTAIVLPCSIKELAYKPLLEFRDYILTFGEFSLKTVVSEIEIAMTSGTHMSVAYPDVVKVGSISRIQFSVDVCSPPSCSTITDISLIFHAQSAVYVHGQHIPQDQCNLVDYLVSIGYDFRASYGIGNVFTHSVNPNRDDPPSNPTDIFTSGGGFFPCIPQAFGFQPSSNDVFSVMSDSIRVVISIPILQDKFKELLTLANCQ